MVDSEGDLVTPSGSKKYKCPYDPNGDKVGKTLAGQNLWRSLYRTQEDVLIKTEETESVVKEVQRRCRE